MTAPRLSEVIKESTNNLYKHWLVFYHKACEIVGYSEGWMDSSNVLRTGSWTTLPSRVFTARYTPIPGQQVLGPNEGLWKREHQLIVGTSHKPEDVLCVPVLVLLVERWLAVFRPLWGRALASLRRKLWKFIMKVLMPDVEKYNCSGSVKPPTELGSPLVVDLTYTFKSAKSEVATNPIFKGDNPHNLLFPPQCWEADFHRKNA
ncbi:MAG: hypothetical protein QXK78_07105 [Candidatus Bathyarchaeia archaeon]